MKRFLVLAGAILLVLSSTGMARAVGFYYTFTGTIEAANIIKDDAGAITAAGLGVGSAVSYTFLVNFDLPGTITYNNGDIVTLVDGNEYFDGFLVGPDPAYDYFYAEYISGDALPPVHGGYFNDDLDIKEYKYGYNYSDGILSFGELLGNSANNYLSIFVFGAIFSDWTVSEFIVSWNEAYDENGNMSALSTLVPEPATMFLLGSGLIGLAGFRRKTKKS